MQSALEPNGYLDMLRLRREAGEEASEELKLRIRNSARSEMYEIFRDVSGKKIGYCVWASVVGDSIRLLIRDGVYPFYYHEWREGNIILILDVCFSSESRSECRRQLQLLASSWKLMFWKNNRRVFGVSVKGDNYRIFRLPKV